MRVEQTLLLMRCSERRGFVPEWSASEPTRSYAEEASLNAPDRKPSSQFGLSPPPPCWPVFGGLVETAVRLTPTMMLSGKLSAPAPAGVRAPQRSGFSGTVAPLRAAQRCNRRAVAKAAQANAAADAMGDPLPSPEKRVRDHKIQTSGVCQRTSMHPYWRGHCSQGPRLHRNCSGSRLQALPGWLALKPLKQH